MAGSLRLGIGMMMAATVVLAESVPWPMKHGGNAGVLTAEQAKGLPTEWSATSNVAWKTPVSGFGHSSPVIEGKRVWFTSATEDGKKQYVYCLDADTGKVLQHKLLFENPNPEPLNNPMNNYAAPTPAVEDGAVYVHFGTYGTARLDPETAAVVWQRRDINARHFRGPGSSPVIHDDLLLLTFDGIDRQFVTALEKKTGKTVWLTERTTDYGDLMPNGKPKGDGDFRKAYGTPLVVTVGDRKQVVSVGSRAAFGYDFRTGKELWTVTHRNFNATVVPVFVPELKLVVLNTGSRGAHLFGVQLDETTKGDVTKSHVKWTRAKRNSRFCQPLVSGGFLYQVSDSGALAKVALADGEEVWSERLPQTCVAGPLLAGKRIYCFGQYGKTLVAEVEPAFKPLFENDLGEDVTAIPAVADGALFIRTAKHVFKIAD